MPRKVILDTQGRAVEKTLKNQTQDLTECRVGRFVELEFAGLNQDQAMAQAHEAAKFVLYNPLIEDYELVPMGEK